MSRNKSKVRILNKDLLGSCEYIVKKCLGSLEYKRTQKKTGRFFTETFV